MARVVERFHWLQVPAWVQISKLKTRRGAHFVSSRLITKSRSAASPMKDAQCEELLGMPPCGLAIPESDAWTIATTWGNIRLHGSRWFKHELKAETMRSDPFAVVESYAWVKIRVDSTADAALVRAVTLAWFWLASCRGYSARKRTRGSGNTCLQCSRANKRPTHQFLLSSR
jgi:hypothetical protein